AFHDEEAYRAVAEKLKLPEYTAEFGRELGKRAAAVQGIPEGFQRDNAAIDLLNFIQRQKGISKADLPMAFWHANTLSGGTTSVHILIDNISSLVGNTLASLSHRPQAIPEAVRALGRGVAR